MKMKRNLSVILALVMLLCSMSITAFAEESAAESPYQIGTKEDLFLFAEKVNDGTYSNVYAELTASIDLEQDDWTSIGTSTSPFTGTFDGNGYTISNLWCAAGQNGLFGYTSTGNYADNTGIRATIKDFTLDGATVTDNGETQHNGAAAVVGCAGMNTYVSGVDLTGDITIQGQRAGGIVGYAYGTSIDDCHVDGTPVWENESTIAASSWAAAGIVGFAGGDDAYSNITNCSVKNVTVNSANWGAAAVAGNVYGNISNVTAENVVIDADSEPDYNGLICAGDVPAGKSYAKNVTLTVGDSAVDMPNDIIATVGGYKCSTLEAAIHAANTLSDDSVTVNIYGKCEYDDATASLAGAYKTINFVGMTDDAEISITRNGTNGYISGSGSAPVVNFTDLILSKPAGAFAGDAGFMNVYFSVYRVAEVNYTNCTFPDGACASGCEVNYTNCEFANTTSGEYSLWVYGDADCTVTESKFTGVRGAKMYAEGAEKTAELALVDTEFTASVTEKPAIVLTYGESVTLENNSYPAKGVFELDVDGSPDGTIVTADITDIACRNDDYDDCGVLVGGKIYSTVTSAAEASAPGDTVILMYSTDEAAEFAENVVIDKNGYTADNITVAVSIWTYDTDAGFYVTADSEKLGLMRFLFAANTTAEIEEVGIKYIKADNINDVLDNTTVADVTSAEDVKVFYGDVIGIPETVTDGNYYAAAYIKVGDEYTWSEPRLCTPNWNQQFTEYNGGEQ